MSPLGFPCAEKKKKKVLKLASLLGSRTMDGMDKMDSVNRRSGSRLSSATCCLSHLEQIT
jgi:hypothetical protein